MAYCARSKITGKLSKNQHLRDTGTSARGLQMVYIRIGTQRTEHKRESCVGVGSPLSTEQGSCRNRVIWISRESIFPNSKGFLGDQGGGSGATAGERSSVNEARGARPESRIIERDTAPGVRELERERENRLRRIRIPRVSSIPGYRASRRLSEFRV